MGTLPEGTRSPIESVGATRKLMEEVARESVAALPNVSVRSGSWVSGLKLAETGTAIEGATPCCDLQLLLKSPLSAASVVLLAMATHCLHYPTEAPRGHCFLYILIQHRYCRCQAQGQGDGGR